MVGININGIKKDKYFFTMNGEEVKFFGKFRNTGVLKEITFFVNAQGYLKCNVTKEDGKQTVLLYHSLKMYIKVGYNPFGFKYVVDHKNENRLDNSFNNLEVVPHRENVQRGSSKNNYHVRVRPSGKFEVYMCFKGSKNFFLGCYGSKNKATFIADQAYKLICEGINFEDWIQWINENSSRKKQIKINHG